MFLILINLFFGVLNLYIGIKLGATLSIILGAFNFWACGLSMGTWALGRH